MARANTSELWWHFVGRDRRLRYVGGEPIEAGTTVAATGRLQLCNNGCHASARALDALRYAPGPVVCRVTLGGQIVLGDDKVCARRRTVLWWADATTALRLFAIRCGERSLLREREAGREPDPRSWAALAEARRFVAGESSPAALATARSVAWAGREETYWRYAAADAAAAWAADAAAAADAWAADAADVADVARRAFRDEANTHLEGLLAALAPAGAAS